MAPGFGDASMARGTGDDLSTVLAELQASGSIHFHKTLARRSQQLGFSQCKQLTQLPLWFVEEHGDKFEEWVILRTLSSAKPWTVHLGISRTQDGNPQVLFRGGWKQFVADNRLEGGDSLVFALNVDARSEFRVYVFRGVSGVQESDDFTASEEAASTSNECNSVGEVPPQHGTTCNPSFCRRILQFDRMEVPASFLRTHRKQLRAEYVKLQGIHRESHVRVIKLYWSHTLVARDQLRLYLQGGWKQFLNANGLKKGQELQFTLIADSSFTVRVV